MTSRVENGHFSEENRIQKSKTINWEKISRVAIFIFGNLAAIFLTPFPISLLLVLVISALTIPKIINNRNYNSFDGHFISTEQDIANHRRPFLGTGQITDHSRRGHEVRETEPRNIHREVTNPVLRAADPVPVHRVTPLIATQSDDARLDVRRRGFSSGTSRVPLGTGEATAVPAARLVRRDPINPVFRDAEPRPGVPTAEERVFPSQASLQTHTVLGQSGRTPLGTGEATPDLLDSPEFGDPANPRIGPRIQALLGSVGEAISETFNPQGRGNGRACRPGERR